ncbi:hypothetical protein R1flu_001494 [Riccia fluitans]|uniref:Uncharacterized protein n=1 Tax=Riccia fluitans TaxID=41844 RepID=A0ABD1Y7E5_9MARC
MKEEIAPGGGEGRGRGEAYPVDLPYHAAECRCGQCVQTVVGLMIGISGECLSIPPSPQWDFYGFTGEIGVRLPDPLHGAKVRGSELQGTRVLGRTGWHSPSADAAAAFPKHVYRRRVH